MTNSFLEITSPLDQFEIRDLLSLDAPILANMHISLTNIGLYLTVGAFIALTLNILAMWMMVKILCREKNSGFMNLC